jgi:hypothetical protein
VVDGHQQDPGLLAHRRGDEQVPGVADGDPVGPGRSQGAHRGLCRGGEFAAGVDRPERLVAVLADLD